VPARAAAATCATSGTSATARRTPLVDLVHRHARVRDPGTYVVTVSVTDDSGQVRSTQRHPGRLPAATAKPPAASSNLLVENPSGANPRLWVVNQDNDSVSVFDAATLAKLGEVAVGAAPRSIARAPNGMIWVVAKQAAASA
jgi:YVTN family beta-propeller protein